MKYGLLLLWVLVSGCGGQPERGHVVVYSAGPRSLAEAVCERFTAETGIEVELFQATTGQLMARLEAEKYRPRADVVLFASEVAAAALKGQNRLMPYSPPASAELRREWSDADGMYHATGAALVGVAVSGEVTDLPGTWKALLTEPGPWRMTMPSPSRSGAAGDFTVGYCIEVEDAMAQFQSARRQGLDIAAANSQALGSLLMGAHHVILGAADYLIYRHIARGEDMRMVFPEEGAVLVTRPIAILSSAHFPEGARRFVDFYFSDAAQRLVSEAFLLPALTSVPVHPVRDSPLPRLIRADPATAVQRQASILRRFQLEVERAVLTEVRP